MASSLSEPGFWILSALAHEELHGYGILHEVTRLTDGDVTLKVPTLYATLDRFERDGLITRTRDEIIDGRARRFFQLTPHGSDTLRDEAERLRHRAFIAQQRLARRTQPTIDTATATAP